jgi:hypothetical protein
MIKAMLSGMNTTTKTGECFKCLGKGQHRAFMHIENGVCFQCHGTGRLEIGETPAPTVRTRTAAEHRERCILDLAVLIRNAQQGHHVTRWDEETFDHIRGLLSVSPDDVRARAVAAFAVAGVTL